MAGNEHEAERQQGEYASCGKTHEDNPRGVERLPATIKDVRAARYESGLLNRRQGAKSKAFYQGDSDRVAPQGGDGGGAQPLLAVDGRARKALAVHFKRPAHRLDRIFSTLEIVLFAGGPNLPLCPYALTNQVSYNL